MSIVVCGNVVCDILARPVEEVRYGATTIVDRIERQLGGNAGTTSYTVATLGVDVSVATLVGLDSDAEFVLEQLRRAGVNLDLVQRVNAPTSVAIALVRKDGERALLYQLGAASEAFAPFELAAHATHFHLAAVYRMRHLREIGPLLLQRAREAGLATSLDAQWDTEGQWMKVLAPSLPYVDYALMNQDEARMLTGSDDPELASGVLRENGAAHVVIKLGARGCWVDGAHINGHVVDTVDTTGAGDCFAGALIAALHRGFTLHEAARFANLVGALAVQRIGATAGILDWESTVNNSIACNTVFPTISRLA